MQTRTKEPYVHHVPVMTGGIGYEGVYNFYKNPKQLGIWKLVVCHSIVILQYTYLD
jgi:hypothetical protein